MTVYDLDRLRARICERLPAKRLAHVLRVEEEVTWLARRVLPAQEMRLRVAALLHDNSKYVPDPDQPALCDRLGIPLTAEERACPPILHAYSGALMAEREFSEYVDKDILRAIRFHTTADPKMTFFDRVLFLADFTERGRRWDRCRAVRAEMHRMPEGLSMEARRLWFERVFLLCLTLKCEYITESSAPYSSKGLVTLTHFRERFSRI